MPRHEAVSTLHRPKNDILAFIKFSAGKSFLAQKKSSCTFLYSFVAYNLQNHVAKPLDSFNMCKKIMLSCRETFFC